MRIQHNIMAMNAYRNYTNNVAAMKKNLEKLSSGYKINRAGDDAAGLAISEKMRAQITGLETAQKNAKDGISLVQTAEGAMTEVHDMLNRMVELASMSANGTYDNTTDRAQLQKEVNQLVDEINRIADSSNFNGIKLLDGSMSTDAAKITGDARIISDVYTSGNAAEQAGTKTFLDGEVATTEQATVFDVDFNGLTAKPAASNGSFTAGTPTDVTTAVTGNLQVDLTGTATDTLAAGDADKIKGATLTIGGTAIDLSALAIADTSTKGDAQAAIKQAILDQVGAANTAGAAGTADYTKVDNLADTDITFNGTDVEVNNFTTTAMTYVAPDNTVTYDFTIGDKKVSASFTPADATAGGTAEEIAAAALTALGGGGGTVAINGVNYTVSDGTANDGKLQFTLADTPTEKNIAANVDWDVTGTNGDTFDGNHTAGVTVTTKGQVHKDAPKANTVFRIEESDITDGTKITIDGTTVTLAVGKNSQVNTNQTGVVNLKYMEEGAVNLDQAISEISKAFTGTVNGANGTNWTVGVNDTSNKDTHKGLTVHKANDEGTYDTKAKLAAIFSIEKAAGGGLTLQIGDTADKYNQLNVSIKDMHAASLGISGVDISTQDGAAEAITKIKDAINAVSDVRGTLGATQNRLDHTINNLGVMTENIQDAESTIRDVDVAEEMMAYTKNNILIQSAQAMLAQANQVPQGVLQLLQ